MMNNYNVPKTQAVKVIAKYIFENIDTAYKIDNYNNIFEIWFNIFLDADEIKNLCINITTYQDTIRVNIFEQDNIHDYERTIAFLSYKVDQTVDVEYIKGQILHDIFKKINKMYDLM